MPRTLPAVGVEGDTMVVFEAFLWVDGHAGSGDMDQVQVDT